MTIYSAVLIGCQRVTDRHTDRQTDRQTDGRTDRRTSSLYLLRALILQLILQLIFNITSEFREHLDIHKTRMNGLSCGEESMTIYFDRVPACDRQTDRQTDERTDGQTDVQPISITCFSIADARKNE